MSVRIGLTGGIGSGKSVVARLLMLMGVPVYNCDEEARRLMLTCPTIRRELTALLGSQVYREGRLNKPLIASYLFASADHAGRINAIVHPQVRLDFRRWASLHSDEPVVAMESAILIEAGFTSEVDRLVEVYAPLEVRTRRIMARDRISRSQAMERIASQMDEEEKRRQADVVIINDGKTAVIPLCEQAIVL